MNHSSNRIIHLALDERSIVRWNPEIEQERVRAIDDLLRDNYFRLQDGFDGPYRLALSLRSGTIIAAVTGARAGDHIELSWPMRSLRRVIKDYFMICESYFRAIKGATASRIETMDMARRGLHNEGASMLADIIRSGATVDDATARRLFTLVALLHLRA